MTARTPWGFSARKVAPMPPRPSSRMAWKPATGSGVDIGFTPPPVPPPRSGEGEQEGLRFARLSWVLPPLPASGRGRGGVSSSPQPARDVREADHGGLVEQHRDAGVELLAVDEGV